MPTPMTITTFVLISLVKTVLAVGLLLTAVAYTTWFERKLVGHIQNRWGPSRVGPFGLLQPMADGLKFILKEDIVPPYANKQLYLLAPLIALVSALMPIAVIPLAPPVRIGPWETPLQITDVNIGLLILLGITSVGVYGVALAGWSSNSKYPLLGGLRSSAQMISYEISLSLGVIGVLMIAGTLSLREIVNQQAGLWAHAGVFALLPRWNLFLQPVGFFVYFIAAIAETNRIPFDLPEGETELVAGFHTEYSSFKFAIFFMSEYANMVTVSCIATLLFFGGWLGPAFGPAWVRVLLPVFWFVLKVFCFLFFYIWVRGTLPRFRYDQLMAFGWKFLLPVGLANILATGAVEAWVRSR